MNLSGGGLGCVDDFEDFFTRASGLIFCTKEYVIQACLEHVRLLEDPVFSYGDLASVHVESADVISLTTYGDERRVHLKGVAGNTEVYLWTPKDVACFEICIPGNQDKEE